MEAFDGAPPFKDGTAGGAGRSQYRALGAKAEAEKSHLTPRCAEGGEVRAPLPSAGKRLYSLGEARSRIVFFLVRLRRHNRDLSVPKANGETNVRA